MKIGDQLLDTEQKVLMVEDTYFEICEEPVTVYNFEDLDFHPYHVGQNNILVHNADYPVDATGKVHGDLPSYSGLTKYTPEELSLLHEQLDLSYRQRIEKLLGW